MTSFAQTNSQNRAPTHRDPWIDNAKLYILTCVVVGHMSGAYINQSGSLRNLHDAIYLFHMPAIIFLMGAFNKPFKNIYEAVNSTLQILFTYLVFQSAFILSFAAIKGKVLNFDLFTFESVFRPQYGLWFLLAIPAWRILGWLLPRHAALLAASYLLAIIVGYFDSFDRLFSASRIICFLPFFLTGMLFGKQILEFIRKIDYRIAILLLLATFGVTHEIFPGKMPEFYFQPAEPYSMAGATSKFAAVYRAVYLILANIASIGFLALIPRSRNFLTERGQHTMHIYIFHLLPVRLIQVYVLPKEYDGITSFALLPIVALLVWFFSSKAFVRRTNFLAHPTWLRLGK